jgi:molybdopterin/thiamine biosynthesis adenylyltransferase
LIDVRRHVELFDPNKFDLPITVIGAGATGSWLLLFLAKLGLEKITAYDFDQIEEHNIANQCFGNIDVGKSKVVAIQDRIEVETGTKINAKNTKFVSQPLQGVVFLLVDSMKERKRIWEQSIKYNPNVKLLIEPRMGMSMGRIYTLDPSNITHIKQYESTLYSDDDTEVSACGSSVSVITSATMIASMCVRQMINWHNEVEMYNELLVDMMYWSFVNSEWKE